MRHYNTLTRSQKDLIIKLFRVRMHRVSKGLPFCALNPLSAPDRGWIEGSLALRTWFSWANGICECVPRARAGGVEASRPTEMGRVP